MKRILANVLILLGVLVTLTPLVAWGYGIYWQRRMAEDFDRRPLTNLASVELSASTRTAATASAPKVRRAHRPYRPRPFPIPKPGGPVGRLQIPGIGLDAIVVEGVDRFALRRGPGHLPETGLPGERRNCAIAAHRDGWFEKLYELRVGEPIWVESSETRYKYVVTRTMVVTPDRTDLLDQGGKPVLTLITCTGPGYPNSRYRLLVFSELRGVYLKE